MAKTAPKEEELAKTADAPLMERPSFIPAGDTTGTEGITTDDIRLPRLAIAQGLSPQLVPGDSSYIKGLTMFDLFNDLTSEVYGKGPLTFVPIRRDVRRIQFKPREEGGGVIDMDIPANDPRLMWRTDPAGTRLPPIATKFNEFVIWLIHGDRPEPIVLSIKDTNKWNRRAATNLNGFIKMHASKGAASVPIYGMQYTVESKPEKNEKGTFGVPNIRQAGYVRSQTLFEAAAKFAKSLEGKNIMVEREPGDETEFDSTAMENGKPEM